MHWGVYREPPELSRALSTFSLHAGRVDRGAAHLPGPVDRDRWRRGTTKALWKTSPARIEERIRELGVKDEHELQSWFIRLYGPRFSLSKGAVASLDGTRSSRAG